MFRKLKMLGLVSVVGLISSLGFIHATQTKVVNSRYKNRWF